MTIQERISELLNQTENNEKINEKSDINSQLANILLNIFKTIPPQGRMEYVREASAYALGKAMERTVLADIRPGTKLHMWIIPMEMQEGIKFNLPPHLEEVLYDYMDACENAVEDYIALNLNLNIADLFNQVQNIGVMLAVEDKVSSRTVAGVSNEKVCTRDELHNFCIVGAEKALENLGYKVVQKILGSPAPVNLIAEKDGKKANVCVLSAVLPNTGELAGYRLHQLERVPQNDEMQTYVMGVSIAPVDELYASMGIILREGEYQFKVSPLNPLLPRKN